MQNKVISNQTLSSLPKRKRSTAGHLHHGRDLGRGVTPPTHPVFSSKSANSPALPQTRKTANRDVVTARTRVRSPSGRNSFELQIVSFLLLLVLVPASSGRRAYERLCSWLSENARQSNQYTSQVGRSVGRPPACPQLPCCLHQAINSGLNRDNREEPAAGRPDGRRGQEMVGIVTLASQLDF